MKVFLSWSGEQSKKVALGLRSWLPDVLQAVTPWMSASDIGAGARWNHEIARELNETSFGILCLTPENLSAPWLLFEAGALAKSIEQGQVCPYLVGIEPEDIPSGPLVQFQAKRSTKEETYQLLQSINAAMVANSLSPESLERTFNLWWPSLDGLLSAARSEISEPRPHRTTTDLLTEVLIEVRGISNRLKTDVASELSEKIERTRQGMQLEKVQWMLTHNQELASKNVRRAGASWSDSYVRLRPMSPRGQLDARIDVQNWHKLSDDALHKTVVLPLILDLVRDYESKGGVESQPPTDPPIQPA